MSIIYASCPSQISHHTCATIQTRVCGAGCKCDTAVKPCVPRSTGTAERVSAIDAATSVQARIGAAHIEVYLTVISLCELKLNKKLVVSIICDKKSVNSTHVVFVRTCTSVVAFNSRASPPVTGVWVTGVNASLTVATKETKNANTSVVVKHIL